MYRPIGISILAFAIMTGLGFAAPAEAQTTLRFEPGKLYEVAMFKITPGKEQEIDKRYFSKAFPLAQQFGMRPIGTFTVDRIEHGPNDVATWGFFEWPDLATKERFESDRRYHELRPIRDGLVDTLRLVYLQVDQPASVTIDPNRMYEFFGVWINRANGAHLQEYFAAAGPFIAEKGVKFIGDFRIVGSPEGYAFLPDSVGFIEWPSKAVKESWFASDAFKRAGYHRALALDRLVVIESSFDVPHGSM